MPLGEAISRVIDVYQKEQRHPAPTDIVAQDLGYKSANNGAALSAIAALKGYGLLERPEAGKLAVSADVQSFHYAPDEALKKKLLRKWLRSPQMFAQLLDQYASGLPSDATIRYDLIQQGFKPGTAETILKAFKESVDFANYYDYQESDELDAPPSDSATEPDIHVEPSSQLAPKVAPASALAGADRIPVRLDAKRRAWLEIPTPFYEADKKRLKAQIDLLITDDENRADSM
jgi:hypothetical protein